MNVVSQNSLLNCTYPFSCDDGEMIKCLYGEMRWMTQVLWHGIRLLLTLWQHIRRKVICSGGSWLNELWQCQCLDVRSSRCPCLGIPGGIEQTSTRVHHAAQNSAQVKTYELFISRIFHLMFLDHSWRQVTETLENETADKGRLIEIAALVRVHYCFSFLICTDN